MNILLYNEKVDGGSGKENAIAILPSLQEKFPALEAKSAQELDPKTFLKGLSEKDDVVLMGGDGALNHFVNLIEDAPLPCPFWLCPVGTSNDLLKDVEEHKDPKTGLVLLNGFLTDLPFIEAKGKTYRFLNGIGFGVDGECCVEAERKKSRGEKDIDYSKIAIHLLFHGFIPRLAKVKVDGVEVSISRSYLASTMNGRYYGGGMMIAPMQKRNSHLLSLVVIHGRGKLGTLMLFPKIFKGTHVRAKKNVYCVQGKEIEVQFDRPCGLQIDGEVIEDVTSYRAYIR